MSKLPYYCLMLRKRLSTWLVACFFGILALNTYLDMVLQPIFACSCGIRRPQVYEDAEIVFVGKVLEKDYSSWIDGAMHVTFGVSKAWKGIDANTVTVHLDSPGCSPPFLDNESYLVIAYQEIIETKMKACSGTVWMGNVDHVEPDIQYLDGHYSQITLTDKAITLAELQILGVFISISLLAFFAISRGMPSTAF